MLHITIFIIINIIAYSFPTNANCFKYLYSFPHYCKRWQGQHYIAF